MRKISAIAALPARAAFALMAALGLTLSLCFLSGCGKSEEGETSGLSTIIGIVTSDDPAQAAEDLVKDAIQSELTKLFLNQGWLSDAIKDIPVDELKEYGITTVANLQDYLANLDYEIGDINLDGNAAKVEIIAEGRTITIGVELVGGEWQLTDDTKAELLTLLLAN